MAGIGASGLRTWLIQRLTAVYLLLFMLVCPIYFLIQPVQSYEQWLSWLSQPLPNASVILFLLFLLIHCWVGLRDVVMDYIKPLVLRLAILALVVLYLSFCFVYGIRILVKVLL